MTGAMLPAGCDAVVPVERISVHGGVAQLAADVNVTAGQNIHARASDQRQGALLLESGMKLEAPDVATAAGAGMARLRVSQQPAFMVISTGNELVEPGEPIQDWQLRRSNAYALSAALRRRGFVRVADDHLPDDADVLQERLKQHLECYEMLILSGGVSMGRFDLVPAALAACGVRQVFHKVAQRPGKPFWFGWDPGGTAVFALPGNPVSTLVCLARYVLPAVDRAMGIRQAAPGEKIALSAAVNFRPCPDRIPARGSGNRRMGASLGADGPEQRLRGLRVACRDRRICRIAPGSQYLPQGFRYPTLSLVSTGMTWNRSFPLTAPRVDRLSRPLRDLRISVMDRCNFRCPYCMPRERFHEHYAFLKTAERLSFEEIIRLARLFVPMGVRKLRITGGEPLLRVNLPDLIADLNGIPGIEDIALTTNGVLLAKHAYELKAAGLARVTVSLDSLDQDIFAKMNGGFGRVGEVLEGIDHANDAGLGPIKINAVIQRGVNEDGVLDLVERFRGTGITVRFIEYMDVGNRNDWREQLVVPSRDLQARIHARWPLRPVRPDYAGEVARRYAFEDGQGEVGFISSVTQPFCGACSRARLSSDGSFYTCLFAQKGTDLRAPLRAGADDDELMRIIRGVWSARKTATASSAWCCAQRADAAPKVEMNYIGG